MNNYYTVKTKEELDNLTEVIPGEKAYCEDESAMYVMSEEGWEKVQINCGEGVQMNLYNINKQIVGQLNPMTNKQIKKAIKKMNEWRKEDAYLLYGKEISYFTFLLNDNANEDFGQLIIDLLKDITDTIYSIELLKDGSFEIWIKYNNESTMLMLFDYTSGICYF